MTVITFDGYILAADSLATNGTIKCRDTDTKLIVIDNVAYAYSGTSCYQNAMIEWYRDRNKPFPTLAKDDNACLIVYDPSVTHGQVQVFEDVPYSYTESWGAWGSGRQIAIGAMYITSTDSAIVGCQCACEKHVYCGGPVFYVDSRDEKLEVVEYKIK